ncbi:uncharacterized protein LOC116344865 [Contarinia nasturtii]|uniref:uncharacterized protein LOC116344865 n=1 Tax=Contarinia nasturtii TaxID=265458 RepID=UPI0012D49CA2|nr:uncharacterized protein LOC116344865 [Contarinia nasturtii]
MKTILFLTFLSLFTQLIHGQDLTIPMVLDKFYAKASTASPNPIKTKLNFMLQITNNVKQIKTKLEVPVNVFMDATKMSQVLAKVPESMTINGTNARKYISDIIGSINIHQIETIKELNDDICLGFSNQLPNYDKDFNNWYQKWNQKPVDKKHLQKIEQNRKMLGKVFEDFCGMFRNGMKTVNDANVILNKYINLGQTSFDGIKKLKNSRDTMKAIDDLVPILQIILKQQEELIKSLGYVQSTLYLYNGQRSKWLDFLINLRDSPFSNRQSIRQLMAKDEELTISLVLNSFYAKAAKSGIAMKSKLDFILKISNNIDQIQSKLKTPVTEFMNETIIGQITSKIPENLTVMGRNARSYLLEEIESVNILQIVMIKEFNDEICYGFSNKMPNKYDKTFENWFKQWNPKPPNKNHVQRVDKYRPTMETIYEKFNRNFDKGIKEAEAARMTLDNSINFVKSSLMTDFLQSTTATLQKTTNAIEELGKLRKQQEQLIKYLGNVQSILHMYNTQRLKWIDFLVELKLNDFKQMKFEKQTGKKRG